MRRREFLGALGGAAAAWPTVAWAQHVGKLPTIGVLGTTTSAVWSQWDAAFVRRLGELGWIDGRTVAFEYRWGEGSSERYREIAAEFARMKVDVVVTTGSGVVATKQLISTIPVVFAVADDPLGAGLVASLARPGGNVTGLSLQQTDVAGKRLGLLREVVPGFRNLAIIGNAGNSGSVLQMKEAQATARTLGIEVAMVEIRRADDIAAGFETIKDRADALYVIADPLADSNRVRINTLALAARLPTMHGQRGNVEAGGLMSYGANFPDLFRRAAEFVDKILRGAKPAELPVEQPTKFDLVINLTTAKALGLTVPPMLLARADEVIE
jgi:putative tryptophan/tyrosine transport system substrate-binding protein